MFDNLIRNLRSILSFTEEELAYFLSLMEIRTFKKYEKIVRIGEPVNYVYYIDKGLVRYYGETDGKEQTFRVFRENMWVSEYAAFLTRQPSMVCIEALEDTTLFRMHFDKMQESYNKAKIFERLGRKMAEALFINEVQMTTQRRLKSPEIRYLELLQNDPEIMRRVPLKYIASLLGIEPESLSRIRKRTSKVKGQ
ncbi:Crp/Fnr family transcriptional regulator [Niabella ginsenosidivorans]|uniref:Crp/Fnr family transcriptional regulator n=1 Tax=Niabella ginsenosidivorans TaxID=1176587 RepID=A0A1A9I889_9BACT|nr:Crp/Fnr family transcriptional regulator [Niabella ginsenosidivorans]ANH82891.1 Crp/Fnr family transcriptional regulator [Niabella ginsenosidivorans]